MQPELGKMKRMGLGLPLAQGAGRSQNTGCTENVHPGEPYLPIDQKLITQ